MAAGSAPPARRRHDTAPPLLRDTGGNGRAVLAVADATATVAVWRRTACEVSRRPRRALRLRERTLLGRFRGLPGVHVTTGALPIHRAAGHGLGPCMLHNGSYDFNDDLLPLGGTYWVQLALKRLAKA